MVNLTKFMRRTFLGLTAGLFALYIYYDFKRDFNPGKQFEKSSSAVEILNEKENIELRDDYGEKIKEKLDVKVNYDTESNTLFIGNYTQDYDRKNWKDDKDKEAMPIYKRHTEIYSLESKLSIIIPENASISKIEEKVYVVPEYIWDVNLKPTDEKEDESYFFEDSKDILDLFTPYVAYIERIKNKVLRKSKKEAKLKEQELIEKIAGKEYTLEVIPDYNSAKATGNTKTAREYKITLNIPKTSSEKRIYVLEKICLGNPTQSVNSFPNKFGCSENILVEINPNVITQKEEKEIVKTEKINLENYLIDKKDSKFVEIVPALPYEEKNPICKDKEEIRIDESYGIERGCEGEYVVWDLGASSRKHRFNWTVLKFESEKKADEFIEKNKNMPPIMKKKNIIAFSRNLNYAEFTGTGITQEQVKAYTDMLFEYKNNRNMEMILSANEEENSIRFEWIEREIYGK